MEARATILILFASGTLALAQLPASNPSGSPEIVVDRATPDIFPESWLTTKVGAKAELLSEKEQQPCREIVSKALGKYPAALLNTNLKKVYVVGHLEYSGVSTGGTNSRSAVYVVSKGKYPPAVVEKNFYAEFSSILLRNFPKNLDTAVWQQINPKD